MRRVGLEWGMFTPMLKLFKRDRSGEPIREEGPGHPVAPQVPASDPSAAATEPAVSSSDPGAPAPLTVSQATDAATAMVDQPLERTAISSKPRKRVPSTSGTTSFVGKTSADFEPIRGVIGQDRARDAIALLSRLEPRSAVFVVAPRSSEHAEAVRTLLVEHASAMLADDAIVVVASFNSGGTTAGLDVLRLPSAEAEALAQGVSSAIEMLSATIPAAFDSDSYRVARIALDEELRSGHDGALDALRRKALAQNIGLLRTTNGYAVVPMHDGRVVRGEIYGALPGSLKSDVEAKLAMFEGELAEVLKNRAQLQQDHFERAKTLERDAANLAVDAALSRLKQRFAGHAEAARWLVRLADDLVANAQLFVAAAREAGGAPRAPAEIATDARLQRYRVAVLSRGARGVSGLELPETLDRAELVGLARPAAGDLFPTGVSPGSLTRPGGGLVAVDVRDLMADYAAWPIIKHALKSARAAPVLSGDAGIVRAAPLDLPVQVRLVVLGEPDEYRSWCRLDTDVATMVRVIDAFPRRLPASEANERLVVRHLSGFVRDDGILPFDGPALGAVCAMLREDNVDVAEFRTDLGPARDLMRHASRDAAASGRVMVLADDVATAIAARFEMQLSGAETMI